MKRFTKILILAITLASGYFYPGYESQNVLAEPEKISVMLANNRDYFPVLHDVIDRARESVKVVLFQARYYLAYPGSSTNVVLLDLVQAAERGVDVTIILDATAWNKQSSDLNRLTGQLLQKRGVKVFYDHPDITTHDKLVLVDGHRVIIGSSNWTNWSFERNNEANILIDDKGIYQEYLEEFNRLLKESSSTYPFNAPQIESTDPNLESYDLAGVSGTVAYTRPGQREKTMDLVLTDSTVVNVHRDITETMVFIDSTCFSRLPGQTVTMRSTIRRGQCEAIDIFVPGIKQKFFQLALSVEEEEQLDRNTEYEERWFKADRIVPINRADYFDQVHNILKEADQRVWVVMLDSRYYDQKPSYARKTTRQEPPSLTNILRADLIDAEKRDVDVIFIYDKKSRSLNNDSKKFLRPVLEAGAELYQDRPAVTTHAKMLVVDDDTVILGSTNWTYPALEENNESAVYIVSKEINAAYAKYVRQVIQECKLVSNFE